MSMQFAYLEMLRPRMIGMVFIIICGIVGILAAIGPAGTYEAFTLPQRVAHSAACAVLAWPIWHLNSVLTLYFMRTRTPLAIALTLAIATLIAGAPVTAVVYAVEDLARPGYVETLHPDRSVVVGLVEIYAIATTVLLSFSALVYYLVCQRLEVAGERAVAPTDGDGAGVAADDEHPALHVAAREVGTDGDSSAAPSIRLAADDADGQRAQHPAPERRQRAAPPTAEGGAAEPRIPLVARLPVGIGSDIIYLKTEGHYIKVHTTTGACMIMMRFKDAVAELDDLGMRVHRSYWVAHRHVIAAVRRDNRTLLRLTGGHRVPVSRSHLHAVRAALAVEHNASE